MTANTTYWLGLHLASDYEDRDEIYWANTDSSSTYGSLGEESFGGTFDNWYTNGEDHASYLTGTPVPEPATMILLGSGLLGLAGVGRKKFFKK